MDDSFIIVFENPSSQERHSLRPAQSEDNLIPAKSHPLSEHISLPHSSYSTLDQSKHGFDADVVSDVYATTKIDLPRILGKSTDGCLRLYQSRHPHDTGIRETSVAKQERRHRIECRDDRNGTLDAFAKETEHAGLAEQVQRRGLWAGP